MGAGIAQVGAQTGHKVTLVDLNKEVSHIFKRITLYQSYSSVGLLFSSIIMDGII